jgi:ABC-type amino acid transport system permease subunit
MNDSQATDALTDVALIAAPGNGPVTPDGRTVVRLDQHLRDLGLVTQWAVRCAVITMLLGLVTGFVVAWQHTEGYAYVGAGVTVIAGSILTGTAVLLLALWARAWTNEAGRP